MNFDDSFLSNTQGGLDKLLLRTKKYLVFFNPLSARAFFWAFFQKISKI